MPPTLALGSRVRKSPFYDAAIAAGMAAASVYNHMVLPVNFGNPGEEYRRLTEGVAIWDVGCQRQVQLAGPDALALAAYLTPRDLSRCALGQGKYVPLCDFDGRLINDPVLLKLADDLIWLSIADSDVLLWAQAVAALKGLKVTVSEPDVSPLAVQGPLAVEVVADLFGEWVRELKYFWFRETDLEGIPLVLARSGWSKQGGYELYLRDGSRGTELWERVMAAGAAYGIGPGAPTLPSGSKAVSCPTAPIRPAMPILSSATSTISSTWTATRTSSASPGCSSAAPAACSGAWWG